MTDKMKNKVKEMLEEKVNDIFLELQEELNIESGDVEPELAMELEICGKSLSSCICDCLNSQLGLHTIEIDFTRTFSTAIKVDVNDEELERIINGDLPSRIYELIEKDVPKADGNQTDDWTVTDSTGVTILDWSD